MTRPNGPARPARSPGGRVPSVRRLAAAAAALALAGCATTGAVSGPRADPWEPMNRAVFGFNEALDAAVVKPVATAYTNVVPEAVRFVVSNMIANIADVWTAANQLLQGKPLEAANDLGRFAINTVFTLGGMGDLAGELGLERHREDFGQTLGRWGVPAGPYLVLPFIGPSSVRDAPAFGVDVLADPLRQVATQGQRNNAWVVRFIDARASLLRGERIVEGAALDKYGFIRDAYLQRRRNLVWDGDPPPEPDDDDADRDAGGARQPGGRPAR